MKVDCRIDHDEAREVLLNYSNSRCELTRVNDPLIERSHLKRQAIQHDVLINFREQNIW